MTNTVGQTEDAGERAVPTNIGKLVHVDENEKSDKDGRKSGHKELLEQQRVLDHTYTYTLCPRTHCGGTARLIGKLKLIYTKEITIQDENDPVE